MKPFAGKVSRTGDSLIMKLSNGGAKVLKNNTSDNEEYANFVFVDHISVLNAYLVFYGGYEYHEYQLFDAATGDSVSIIGVPQFSPDKRFFICSNADLMASFTTNGFELFSTEHYKKGPLQLRELQNWGPVTIKWKDAQSFVAHVQDVPHDLEVPERYVKLVPR